MTESNDKVLFNLLKISREEANKLINSIINLIDPTIKLDIFQQWDTANLILDLSAQLEALYREEVQDYREEMAAEYEAELNKIAQLEEDRDNEMERIKNISYELEKYINQVSCDLRNF